MGRRWLQTEDNEDSSRRYRCAEIILLLLTFAFASNMQYTLCMDTNYNTIHVNYLSESEYVLQSTDSQNTNHYPISYIVSDLFMNQITRQANAIFYKH